MSKIKNLLVAALVVAASLVGMQGVAHATTPTYIAFGCASGAGGNLNYYVGTRQDIVDSGGSDHYYLTLGSDGNLVIFHDWPGNHVVLWQSYTSNSNVTRLAFQTDGNIVLYRSPPSIVLVAWATDQYTSSCYYYRTVATYNMRQDYSTNGSTWNMWDYIINH